jgi:soluble lytic murein transglycosylase-like protein
MQLYLRKLILLMTLMFWAGAAVANSDLPQVLSDSMVTGNDPGELVALAVKYEHAEGFPRDRERAAGLYCRAARLGSPDALYALGWMYANGRGVERDDSIAVQLFLMAAEQGHAYAQKMIRYTPAILPSRLPACLQSDIEDKYEKAVFYPDDQVSKLVHKLAPDYQIDPRLVLAVISVESGFNTQAVSPKNARGLMQLIPETAQRFRVKDPLDPEENIKGGMAYLRWLLAFFKGDVTLVAAAYNAGEGAVEKYRGIPPYQETVSYVEKIRMRYKKSTHPYQSDIVNRTSVIVSSNSVEN